MITVYDDAPEQNKELKERGTTDAQRLCLRAVGEPLGKIKAAAGALPAAKVFCLPLTSELGLTAVRSRSRENNTQLFSNTLAPFHYALCAENANPRSPVPEAEKTCFLSTIVYI